MAFGLGKLADVIDRTTGQAPYWVVEALKEAEASDVLKRLVTDACTGVELALYIPEIPVRLFGRKILTVGPIRMWLTGYQDVKAGEDKANTQEPGGEPRHEEQSST